MNEYYISADLKLPIFYKILSNIKQLEENMITRNFGRISKLKNNGFKKFKLDLYHYILNLYSHEYYDGNYSIPVLELLFSIYNTFSIKYSKSILTNAYRDLDISKDTLLVGLRNSGNYNPSTLKKIWVFFNQSFWEEVQKLERQDNGINRNSLNIYFHAILTLKNYCISRETSPFKKDKKFFVSEDYHELFNTRFGRTFLNSLSFLIFAGFNPLFFEDKTSIHYHKYSILLHHWLLNLSRKERKKSMSLLSLILTNIKSHGNYHVKEFNGRIGTEKLAFILRTFLSVLNQEKKVNVEDVKIILDYELKTFKTKFSEEQDIDFIINNFKEKVLHYYWKVDDDDFKERLGQLNHFKNLVNANKNFEFISTNFEKFLKKWGIPKEDSEDNNYKAFLNQLNTTKIRNLFYNHTFRNNRLSREEGRL